MPLKSTALLLCLTAGVFANHKHIRREHARRATATVNAASPGPTHSGTAANCNEWYTVQSGDDCSIPEGAYGITHAQFLEWNPAVSEDCVTNFWPTYSYCVGVGDVIPASSKTTASETSRTSTAGETTKSSSSITIPITTTANTTYSVRYPVTEWNITTATRDKNWPPTQTMTGQPPLCNNWYRVLQGDTCDTVVRSYASSMDMDDLLAWNPTLGEDCTGLYFNWWVCVGVKSAASLTLVYPDESTTASLPDPTDYTPTTNPTVDWNFIPELTQAGLVSGCRAFYQAVDGDTCTRVLDEYNYITSEQLHAWNPALGSDCGGIWEDYYYCVASFASAALPMPPTVTAKPSPVETGTPSDCQAWYKTTLGDDCDLIVEMFGTMSKADLISWNPAVWDDCSNIQEGDWYCVAISGTPTTRTTPLTPIVFPTDNPKQTGIAADCSSFWVVSQSDTCEFIASFNGISIENFYAWNPAVGSDSCTNLLPDYYVCLGVGGSTSIPTTTTSTSRPVTTTGATSSKTTSPEPTTTAPSNGVTTPLPIQDGVVSNCGAFYLVQVGDGCATIVVKYDITVEQFVAWNPAVGPSCANLWSNTYACVSLI